MELHVRDLLLRQDDVLLARHLVGVPPGDVGPGLLLPHGLENHTRLHTHGVQDGRLPVLQLGEAVRELHFALVHLGLPVVPCRSMRSSVLLSGRRRGTGSTFLRICRIPGCAARFCSKLSHVLLDVVWESLGNLRELVHLDLLDPDDLAIGVKGVRLSGHLLMQRDDGLALFIFLFFCLFGLSLLVSFPRLFLELLVAQPLLFFVQHRLLLHGCGPGL
mmetsp:Transcript_20130/g.63033  ORF Transcript_20130/g.63033 Transcript_20130/m.63033 type:complete len:218 (+) Transcript_20130:803-1456(+)